MNRTETLSILNQGSHIWNKWRNENPEIKPFLASLDINEIAINPSDLRRCDLHGAILRDSKLNTVDLSEANLAGADLTHVRLIGSELNFATLNNADLRWAHLNDSGLDHANLEGAQLCWADLSNASLEYANMNNADLEGVNLCNANLSKSKLEKTRLFKAQLCCANLSLANLSDSNLGQANLDGAILTRAKFLSAYLHDASVKGIKLPPPDYIPEGFILQQKLSFRWANLRNADFTESELVKADFFGSDLIKANFTGANLTGANFERASLVETNFTQANLTDCNVYGISAWDLTLHESIQNNLNISPYGDHPITVDNIEVAQFIYLLLHNEKLRDVIDTVSKKAVLILGRFTPKRKEILSAIREKLRLMGYLPILFDFEKPSNRDLTETISTLAHLSRFIIVDITAAKSVPQELQSIIPNLPSVAVKPILQKGNNEYAMFEHFRRYTWVLPLYEYNDIDDLQKSLINEVITPSEEKVKELRRQ